MMDQDEQLSWDYAKRYAEILSTMPERLQRAIKDLRKDQPALGESREAIVPFAALNTLKIIYRSARFKIPIYFAASQLYPERFALAEDDTEKALLQTLGIKLFATLLTLVWYRRRLMKVSPSEDTTAVIESMLIAMELGFHAGKLLPDLGPGDAMMISAVRYAAVATLMVGDPETFRRYRNLHKGTLNGDFERERWKCDHAQISSYLLHAIGMPYGGVSDSGARRTVFDFREALLGQRTERTESDTLLRTWAAVVMAIDSIMRGKPNTAPLCEVGLSREYAKSFEAQAIDIVANGSSFRWMLRGGDEEPGE